MAGQEVASGSGSDYVVGTSGQLRFRAWREARHAHRCRIPFGGWAAAGLLGCRASWPCAGRAVVLVKNVVFVPWLRRVGRAAELKLSGAGRDATVWGRKRRTRPLGPLVTSGFLHNIYVTPPSAAVRPSREIAMVRTCIRSSPAIPVRNGSMGSLPLPAGPQRLPSGNPQAARSRS